MTDEILFRPKTKFDQIFSWTTHSTARKTVEFVLDRKLAPGASLTVTYEVYIPSAEAKVTAAAKTQVPLKKSEKTENGRPQMVFGR